MTFTDALYTNELDELDISERDAIIAHEQRTGQRHPYRRPTPEENAEAKRTRTSRNARFTHHSLMCGHCGKPMTYGAPVYVTADESRIIPTSEVAPDSKVALIGEGCRRKLGKAFYAKCDREVIY